MQKRKVQRAFMQAQTCRRPVKTPGRKDTEAPENIQQKYTALSRSRDRIQRRGDVRVHETKRNSQQNT